MSFPTLLLALSLAAVIVAGLAAVARLRARIRRLEEDAGETAAKLAVVSRFLRASKALGSDLGEFNKALPQDADKVAEEFALERWRSFQDKNRFARWRSSAGRITRKELRDDSYYAAFDVERELRMRANARPFLAVLHQRLPFLVSQEHVDWLEQTDCVQGFLEWLIGDVEKGSQGKPPAELESIRALIVRR